MGIKSAFEERELISPKMCFLNIGDTGPGVLQISKENTPFCRGCYDPSQVGGREERNRGEKRGSHKERRTVRVAKQASVSTPLTALEDINNYPKDTQRPWSLSTCFGLSGEVDEESPGEVPPNHSSHPSNDETR